jgi:hypothetical protein
VARWVAERIADFRQISCERGKRILQDDGAKPETRHHKAICLQNLARKLFAQDRDAEGITTLRMALALEESLTAEFPDYPDYSQRRASIIEELRQHAGEAEPSQSSGSGDSSVGGTRGRDLQLLLADRAQGGQLLKANRSLTISSRCRRPLWQSISKMTASPGSPSIPTCGFAQSESRGHLRRGSIRGCLFALDYLRVVSAPWRHSPDYQAA